MSIKSTLARLIRYREDKIVCTGGVVFIGEGNAGKTHTALNITSYQGRAFYDPTDNSLRKSLNLELNYFIFHSNIEEYQMTTSSQIFIMPGQKGRANPGEGLAFEDAFDMYNKISSINVVLTLVLTYDLTDITTFQELEYWLEKAIERDIIHEYTSIIILGTHLDMEEKIAITDEYLDNAREFVHSLILEKRGISIPMDNIYSIKVSNKNNEGIEELKRAINRSFIQAFRMYELINGSENSINPT